MDNRKKLFIKAYKLNKCNITKACEAMEMSRQTFYDWMNSDAEFKVEAENAREERLDHLEDKLFELVDGATYDALTHEGEIVRLQDKPNPTSVIFALKTLGKHRGYIERQEIDATIQPVQINVGITSTDSDDDQNT